MVTGAASGIGFGLAERFAAEGMKVVLAGVETQALEGADERLKKKGATMLADPSDPRTDDIGGDVPLPSFGLHIIDANLGMGDLVEIVARQAEPFSAEGG